MKTHLVVANESGSSRGIVSVCKYAYTSLACGLVLSALSASANAHEALDKSVEVQNSTQKAAVASQARVDQVVDETQGLLSRYRQVLLEVDSLVKYNDQLSRLVSGQEKEILSLQRQLEEFEVTKRDIVPMMLRMLDTLVRLVALDFPFLHEERQKRIEALTELMDDPQAEIPEKFRRLMEAYQVEVQYGRTIEAMRESITIDGQERMVDTLRIGRLGLYYRTLDGEEVGYWDKNAGGWRPLPEGYAKDIDKGLRIARKQAAPQLIKLYLPTARGES